MKGLVLKELKEAVSFGVALGNALGKSLEDGKVDYADLLTLWEPITKAPDAFDGASKIIAEVEGLTQEQTEELVQFIKGEFDIPQDEIEIKVEAALNIVLGVMKFVSSFKKKG